MKERDTFEDLNSTVVTTEGKRCYSARARLRHLNSTVVTTEECRLQMRVFPIQNLNSTVVTTEGSVEFNAQSIL